MQGPADGVRELDDKLAAGGRRSVVTPDLFDGRTFSGIEEGFARFGEIVEDDVLRRGTFAVTGRSAIGPWPDGVPVQIHGMDENPFFAGERVPV
ncbi:MAG: hypothetical protein ACTHXO_00370 [Actinomycetaceae bacterium]